MYLFLLMKPLCVPGETKNIISLHNTSRRKLELYCYTINIDPLHYENMHRVPKHFNNHPSTMQEQKEHFRFCLY